MSDSNPYLAPQSAYAQEPDDEVKQYDRIGGWLILVTIGLGLTIVTVLVALGTVLLAFRNQYAISANPPPALIFLLSFEGLINFLIGVGAVVGLTLMFRLSRRLPPFMIGFYLFNATVVMIDGVLVATLTDVKTDPREMGAMIRAVVAAVIWVSYFAKSKRVQGTFTR